MDDSSLMIENCFHQNNVGSKTFQINEVSHDLSVHMKITQTLPPPLPRSASRSLKQFSRISKSCGRNIEIAVGLESLRNSVYWCIGCSVMVSMNSFVRLVYLSSRGSVTYKAIFLLTVFCKVSSSKISDAIVISDTLKFYELL